MSDQLIAALKELTDSADCLRGSEGGTDYDKT